MLAFALLSGLLFGFGLIISGMANPAKVLGFLDVAGLWDPSLIFVMLGAISISFVGFRLAKQRNKTLIDTELFLPNKQHVDRPLIIGSLLFGIGWGLTGICPGPAVVLLGTASVPALVFFVALVAGFVIYQVLQSTRLGK